MTLEAQEYIAVYGARVHNLKNIDVKIPRDKLVVITGLSGSGKSSLAFDTIYAEGQRRYIETFAAYARQFLGGVARPDVDKIEGLSPVISIEQKTTNKSPRSTVGTITEIYDFLRLLFARASAAYSFNTGEKMVSYTDNQIKELILNHFDGKKISILAPIVRSRKGHYRELFQQIAKQGFLRVRIDGQIQEIETKMQVDRYKTHDIEVVIDQLSISKSNERRLELSLQTAFRIGKNMVMLLDNHTQKPRYFSKDLMCPSTGISYPNPEPNSFSFNSPKGACPHCNGLGVNNEVNEQKVLPDMNLSISRGGIAPLGEQKNSWIFRQLETIAKCYQFTLDTPIGDIPKKALQIILHGGKEKISVPSKMAKVTRSYEIDFEGIMAFIAHQHKNTERTPIKRWAMGFMDQIVCTACKGSRLKKESLHFRIADKNISDLTQMDVLDLSKWMAKLDKKLSKKQQIIASEILKETRTRIQFIIDVGLGYLALNRTSKSLSGGEAQRIRLATQIGTQLVGVLYILDEPSIGLHQRDNQKLIHSLLKLRDTGNSVLVVEHDEEMIRNADFVLDIGPGAGRYGGEVVSTGTFSTLKKQHTLTADYLSKRKQIPIPKQRRPGNQKYIKLIGAKGNNLKNISVKFPLGKMICVTGVSGSGKSTLINETLYPILNQHIYKSVKEPMPYSKIQGLEYIDKVIAIDQSPIGRTPRSNPATYTSVFTDIRSLFAQTPEAAIRGYKPGRFSFNVKGGRCETCHGGGVRIIEMNFLPDVTVECETCRGRRFNSETLEVRYRGKSISDVLQMTINEAVRFFEPIPKIYRKLKTIQEVGLGYITLGQPSTTISGGEAQRIKLASELTKRATGNTFYILDEPTTGLHFEDIRVLMEILDKLTDKGNTVLIIEHNLEVIKLADHIIDIGQEGGKKGGKILCEGSPEEIVRCPESYTAQFLKKERLIA